MSIKKCPKCQNPKWMIAVCIFLSIAVTMATVRADGSSASIQAKSDQAKPPEIERITAEELRAKIARKSPVIIIDVRATNDYVDSKSKIKDAIHVKLRRLQARLALPPLKDIPRDREVVTYCACPNEETSVRAAQVLLAAGFKRVRALKGGWQAWLKASGQVEQTPKQT